MDRRAAMKWAVGGMAAAAAAVTGIPALVAGFAPLGNRTSRPLWRSLGPLQAFPVGLMQNRIVALPEIPGEGSALRERSVYAWRPSPGEAIVYSRSCTDLGCPLTFDAGSECFFCPCHGGIFSKHGERMAGPPSRPMYRYAARIRHGEILIDLNSLPPMA